MTIPRKLVIAIDGPAGSGKSTVSKTVAERLGYCYVDTGAMYRAIAWKALYLHVSLQDAEAVTELARQAKLELTCDPRQFQISVDGTDVTTAIRTPEISDASSKVSALAAVRRELVAQQQQLGEHGGVVMEGRDIGTVVFPKADLKIFLDASPEARGDRRHAQDIVEGKVVDRDQTLEEVRKRDHRDASRATSPMVAAPDAVHLDTTHLSVDEVVEKILGLFERVQGGRGSRSL
jgi:cytidylate kinase